MPSTGAIRLDTRSVVIPYYCLDYHSAMTVYLASGLAINGEHMSGTEHDILQS